MLSPTSSSGSIRRGRRAPIHPGVRVPFPYVQSQEFGNFKLSQTTSTVGQAIEQLHYLVKKEVNQFDEFASSVKNIYGVGVVYDGAHLNLESMLSRVSLDIPYGYDPRKLRIGSISCMLLFPHGSSLGLSLTGGVPPLSPQDSFHVDIVPSPPTLSAKSLRPSGSWNKSKTHTRVASSPTSTMKPSSGQHSTSSIDSNTKELSPPRTTNSDISLLMPIDIFDPDTTLSSSTANESYSEDLYDWLQTQGTQTQIKQSGYSRHKPSSFLTCSFRGGYCVGEDPTTNRNCALGSNSADNSLSQQFDRLSPPLTVRTSKINPRIPLLASGLPHLECDSTSTTGLGLFLPSHSVYDDAVDSIASAPVSKTDIFGPHPKFEAKERQQLPNSDYTYPTPQSGRAQDRADRPPPAVRRHFMHVVAELKLKSTERSADKASSSPEKADPLADQSQSAGNDLDDKVPGVAEPVEGHSGTVKTIGKTLLEQSLLQEEQAQKLRILAEALCEMALLRRALSGMLGSKYEYEAE